MKKITEIIIHFFGTILLTPIFAIFTAFDGGNFSDLNDSNYWLSIFIITIITAIFVVYFMDINPRKYICINMKAKSIYNIFLMLLILLMFPLFILASIIAEKYRMIAIIIVVSFVVLFMIMVFYLIKGLRVYKYSGNILVVNDKIKLYKKGEIENIEIIKQEKLSILNVIINSENNYFYVKTVNVEKYKNDILDQINKLNI